jgi:hypothetical protein
MVQFGWAEGKSPSTAQDSERQRDVRHGCCFGHSDPRVRHEGKTTMSVPNWLTTPSFSGRADGSSPWLPNRTTKGFAAARRGAGLGHFRLHDLQHFMATLMLAGRRFDRHGVSKTQPGESLHHPQRLRAFGSWRRPAGGRDTRGYSCGRDVAKMMSAKRAKTPGSVTTGGRPCCSRVRRTSSAAASLSELRSQPFGRLVRASLPFTLKSPPTQETPAGCVWHE